MGVGGGTSLNQAEKMLTGSMIKKNIEGKKT